MPLVGVMALMGNWSVIALVGELARSSSWGYGLCGDLAMSSSWGYRPCEELPCPLVGVIALVKNWPCALVGVSALVKNWLCPVVGVIALVGKRPCPVVGFTEPLLGTSWLSPSPGVVGNVSLSFLHWCRHWCNQSGCCFVFTVST